MRFAHMGDCHLGGWRQPEMVQLNMDCFRFAIDKCIKEKLDFVLIAGDLFDNAYPPLDIIKDTFNEFRKLKEANIPVFYIAGSHDYSATGRSFLDVLEKAGFAKNAYQPEERGESIYLHPVIYKNVALYGYPGKKSGLEVEEIARIKIHDAPGLFKILMLHTALRDAIGNLPIPAVDQDKLPRVDYTALAHLHVHYAKNNRVYCGPLFPNNTLELEELQGGSFCIVDTSGKLERVTVNLKPIKVVNIEINNALTATDLIIDTLKKEELKDLIIILRLRGLIEIGKSADIRFNDIESFVKKQGAYSLLRNTSKLYTREMELVLRVESENLEETIINRFQSERPHVLNTLISPLISLLQIERKEEEKVKDFHERLIEDSKKVLPYEIK